VGRGRARWPGSARRGPWSRPGAAQPAAAPRVVVGDRLLESRAQGRGELAQGLLGAAGLEVEGAAEHVRGGLGICAPGAHGLVSRSRAPASKRRGSRSSARGGVRERLRRPWPCRPPARRPDTRRPSRRPALQRRRSGRLRGEAKGEAGEQKGLRQKTVHDGVGFRRRSEWIPPHPGTNARMIDPVPPEGKFFEDASKLSAWSGPVRGRARRAPVRRACLAPCPDGKVKGTPTSRGEKDMADYVAAIDQGTPATRCLLFDHAGSPVGGCQRSIGSSSRGRAGWNTTRGSSGSGPRRWCGAPWGGSARRRKTSRPWASRTSGRRPWSGTAGPERPATTPSCGRIPGPMRCAGSSKGPTARTASGAARAFPWRPTSPDPSCAGSWTTWRGFGPPRCAVTCSSGRSTAGSSGTSRVGRTAACTPPIPPTPPARSS